MKKLITAALCSLVVLGAGAQKANVDAAKKLAGKIDKIEEARALIQQALQNPETAGQLETLYIAGKIEMDAYEKNIANQALTPDKVQSEIDMSNELLNAYNFWIQVFPLDQLPNEKGEVKPKHTKELQKKIGSKFNDFFNAGGAFFNNKMYPQAYDAFMIYGDMPEMEVLGKDRPEYADTIRATAYFNAGLAAWSDDDLDRAAVAFKKTRLNNYSDPSATIYEIACWQNIEQRDTTGSRSDEARDAIYDAAKSGYEKFGMSQPVFLNNMVNTMINSGRENQAVEIVNDAIANNPDMANLYGLRAFIYDRIGNESGAEADYRTAAELPNVDYETIRNAVSHLLRIGQEKWNNIELGDVESHNKKQDIRSNYFQKAKDYAEKAKTLENADNIYLDDIIERIDYILTLK